MKQIVVEFFACKKNFFGEETLEKKVIRTGKSNIEEAFDVAVDHGHNPSKNIRWWSEQV